MSILDMYDVMRHEIKLFFSHGSLWRQMPKGALTCYVKSNAIRISAQSYYFRNKIYKLKCVLYVYLTKINTPYYGKKKGYRKRENRNLHLKSNSATQLPYLQKLLTFQASFFSYDWYENNEKVYVKHLLYTSFFNLKIEMKCDLLPIPICPICGHSTFLNSS